MAEGCGAGRGIPHSLVFPLFSETGVGVGGEVQLANCPVPPSPPHLRPEAADGFDTEASFYFLLVLLGH